MPLVAALLGLALGLVGSGLRILAAEDALPALPSIGAAGTGEPPVIVASKAAPVPGAQELATPRAVPEACVAATLPERAASLLVVGLPGVTDADDPLARTVMDLGVGGVLLTKTNVTGSQQVSDLVTGLRARADDEIVIATDEEPGRVSSFGALFGRSSSARTLAGRGAPTAVREAAEVLATDLAELGVDIVLAPVADLDDGPSDGVIGDRSFSADPYTATAFVRAHADGLLAGGVLPAVKHFPGHGRTRVDSHVRLDVVDADLEELTATDLQPFADQIDRGTPIVMLGHVAYTALDEDLPASLAPAAYDLLRDLGFDGVAMTDSLGMGAINQRWDFPEAAVMAVEAGADALLATDGTHARRMRDALVAAVRDGSLPESRLDEAAGRMAELTGNAGEQAGCGSR